MSLVPYADAVPRPLTDILGDSLSVLTWGALADGSDDGPRITAAIAASVALGGRRLLVPGGRTYTLDTPVYFPAGVCGVELVGDGQGSTVFERGANMPSGVGVFDLPGSSYVKFKNFTVDGATLTSEGKLYGTFTDPLDADFTTNSSFWLHGGTTNVSFDQVEVRHTGGYIAAIDATSSGNIDSVTFFDCNFHDNRPFAFGPSGDTSYGSWPGGILAEGDGSTYCAKNIAVIGCSFKRSTGNQFWTHLYGFGKMHENITCDLNTFEDIGRDGVMFGGVVGGSAYGNKFRRIGYMTTSDVSASVPKWLDGQWAVAVDTSGLTKGVNFIGNIGVSCNGGCLDLDGFSNGTVSGNNFRTPVVGEPEYTQDSIGSGFTWSYGVNQGNTSGLEGGDNVTVVNNTFKNLTAGSIRMYAARRAYVAGNHVYSPAAPLAPPIILGNIGLSTQLRAFDNVVTANYVYYDPALPAPAIFEDATYQISPGVPAVFSPTDINNVYGNFIISSTGKAYEFKKDPTSGTSSGQVYSSAAGSLTVRSEHSVKRAGKASDFSSSLQWSNGEAASSETHMHLQAYRASGVREPLLNVSKAGAANTGVIATGSYTSLNFGHSVITGKVWADSFLVLTDNGFSNTDANNVPASFRDPPVTGPLYTTLVLRWDSALAKLQMSTSFSGPNRVWSDFGGGGGVTGSIQVKSGAGTLSGFSSFIYDDVIRKLTVDGIAGAAGVDLFNAFYNAQGAQSGFRTTGTAYNAIQAPLGGVLALQYLSVREDGDSSFIAQRTDTASGHIARAWGIGVAQDGSLVLRDRTSSTNVFTVDTSNIATFTNRLIVSGSSGIPSIVVTNGYIQSTQGFYSPGSTYNLVQVPSGGMFARSMYADVYTQVGRSFGVPAPTSGQAALLDGAIYYDTQLGVIRARVAGSIVTVQTDTGGAGVSSLSGLSGALTLAGGTGVSVTPSGSTLTLAIGQSVAASDSPTFVQVTATGAFVSSVTGATLGININSSFLVSGAGAVSGAGVFSSTGASGGFNVTAQTAANSIQTVGGFNSTGSGYHVSGVNVIDSGRNGRFNSLVISAVSVVDSSRNVDANTFKLNGTTVITAVRAATFASVTTEVGGAFNSQQASAGLAAFQTSNNKFIVDGAGNISATSELNLTGVGTALYKMKGATVIDNNGAFVGSGVYTPNYGHAASGFNPFVASVQYFGGSQTFIAAGLNWTFKGGAFISAV